MSDMQAQSECFGEDARGALPSLREFIDDETADSRYYALLARKAPTRMASREIMQISRDEMRHARRFMAAYYMISGSTHEPKKPDIMPWNIPPYRDALRVRFMAEERDARKYKAFAESTNDRCLKRIALDTSADESRHADTLLMLLGE